MKLFSPEEKHVVILSSYPSKEGHDPLPKLSCCRIAVWSARLPSVSAPAAGAALTPKTRFFCYTHKLFETLSYTKRNKKQKKTPTSYMRSRTPSDVTSAQEDFGFYKKDTCKGAKKWAKKQGGGGLCCHVLSRENSWLYGRFLKKNASNLFIHSFPLSMPFNTIYW